MHGHPVFLMDSVDMFKSFSRCMPCFSVKVGVRELVNDLLDLT